MCPCRVWSRASSGPTCQRPNESTPHIWLGPMRFTHKHVSQLMSIVNVDDGGGCSRNSRQCALVVLSVCSKRFCNTSKLAAGYWGRGCLRCARRSTSPQIRQHQKREAPSGMSAITAQRLLASKYPAWWISLFARCSQSLLNKLFALWWNSPALDCTLFRPDRGQDLQWTVFFFFFATKRILAFH